MKHAQRVGAAVVFGATALGGCAGTARVAAPPTPSPALATVSGTVRVYGGPIRPDGTMPLNGNPMATVAPVVVKQAGRVTERSSTDAGGHYTLHLPAGTYSIYAGCSQTVSVVLRAGQRLHRDLPCDVP